MNTQTFSSRDEMYSLQDNLFTSLRNSEDALNYMRDHGFTRGLLQPCTDEVKYLLETDRGSEADSVHIAVEQNEESPTASISKRVCCLEAMDELILEGSTDPDSSSLLCPQNMCDVRETDEKSAVPFEKGSCIETKSNVKSISKSTKAEIKKRKRREFHKVHTRRSRAKLNQKMEELKAILPVPMNGMAVKSKAQVIDYAISVLQHLFDHCELADSQRSSTFLQSNVASHCT